MIDAYRQGHLAAHMPRLKPIGNGNHVLIWPDNPFKWWQFIRYTAWEYGKADGLSRE